METKMLPLHYLCIHITRAKLVKTDKIERAKHTLNFVLNDMTPAIGAVGVEPTLTGL